MRKTPEPLAIEEIYIGVSQTARRKAESTFEYRLQHSQIELKLHQRLLVEVIGAENPFEVVTHRA